MNKAIVPLLVCVLAASCLTGGFRPQSPDPVLWVEADRYDFGNIPATEPVGKVFKVTNKGGKDLNISRVQTTCGCTAAVLDSQMLKPGESTRLKVTFDPRGKGGPQTRPVWIYSNDPKAPQKSLTITSNVLNVTPPPTSSAFPTPVSATAMQPSMSAFPTPVSSTAVQAPAVQAPAVQAPAVQAPAVQAPAVPAPAPAPATP